MHNRFLGLIKRRGKDSPPILSDIERVEFRVQSLELRVEQRLRFAHIKNNSAAEL
ncbi:MAG: hypothetical protein LBP75_00010 [Planctomycetota bacterium]|nr:hypothetical protein [Planctomycetota bacterium]